MIKLLNQVSLNKVYPFAIRQNIIPVIPRRLNAPLQYDFSKGRKTKVEFQSPTINISKFQQKHDGFLLYQNDQGNRIKIITLGFIGCFLSGYWTYRQLQDDELKVNYMILGAFLLIPFFIYYFRASRTLKKLVLDKTGQNILITRFNTGGFREETTKAKIQVLRGIGKAFVFGGNVIKGGGTYGLEQRNYWFQSKFIKQQTIFEQAVQGHRIKVEKVKVKI